MQFSLKDLKVGDKGRIKIDDNLDIAPKYIELGLTPGAIIEVKSKAPLGGLISVKLLKNNVLLALRKAEAHTLLIEKI
ncbi:MULTISPECIES: FeoA family protein [Weeksella]|uniref:FeoA family protein n=1 Tax=Weeksella virosa (strain ATCC 43766 / DSM 16922 / JCM 21250 / CCUG 30538 / CDC 9751 / IAM 14551 / NBRC 16016 / NCTC 11634 / CL345/78) TaxID=865938 RepID=F0P2I8_WEEVC|nr:MULTISPECIES: FeoA family protein [Weeksella]ADX67827.1 FeoA family protein [Weeksella virosa DSM 16922]MDK7374116.1 FeoA family protein [Weeksella virosa]MDK7674428.1 FeoA family protein [Weeksella virosa]OFM82796.1 hypothetical protein HMPREF2660_03870 [Weeksella sp. HMSC059D05]SUP54130.1 FeoA domain [Weeksella virosa]